MTSTEQLLRDASWLRSLARRLAHDHADADDLVQESWIAAWQRQPDPNRPMRGWLTKVIRDLARMKRRSDQRRGTRDANAADLQVPAAPDELLEQMRLQRRLVDLVLELDEPYRSTIIAHFVEGRTSASIAKSLGIPAGTVRKRLWEALSRLRAGLDAHAGDRKRWAPAVLAITKGGFYVAKTTKLVIAIVALVLLFGITAAIYRRTHPPAVASLSTAPGGTATTSSAPLADASPTAAIPDARATDRATLLAAITNARDRRTAAAARPTAEPAPPPALAAGSGSGTVLGIVDKTGDSSEWSKRALATINALFGQCYDLGRAEDPAFGGSIVVEFKIVGEPGIGGLLEQAEIIDGPDTTIKQQTFRDCVLQQLYALELDPPPEGTSIARRIDISL